MTLNQRIAEYRRAVEAELAKPYPHASEDRLASAQYRLHCEVSSKSMTPAALTFLACWIPFVVLDGDTGLGLWTLFGLVLSACAGYVVEQEVKRRCVDAEGRWLHAKLKPEQLGRQPQEQIF